MTLVDLRRELVLHGVSLSQTPEGKLGFFAPHGLPPELLIALKLHKDALLAELQLHPVKQLSPLPEPIVRLVNAAVGNHLNTSTLMPTGQVPNLGDFVLSSAALYACAYDPALQLKHLWLAHEARRL